MSTGILPLLTKFINHSRPRSKIPISKLSHQLICRIIITNRDHLRKQRLQRLLILLRSRIRSIRINHLIINRRHNKRLNNTRRLHRLLRIHRTIRLRRKIHHRNSPAFTLLFLHIHIIFFNLICKCRKMLPDRNRIRCNNIEILINTIRDCLRHRLMICRIGDIQIIILITHKSHLKDRNRNSTPVGSRHIIRRDHPKISKPGRITVMIDDTACKRITFLNDILIQILIGRSRSHRKRTGRSRTVIAICMDTHRDISTFFRSKFRAFLVADSRVVILTGHNNIIPT